jgi:hypothetical protein
VTGWTRACTSSGNCIEAAATGYGNIILRGSEAPQHTIIVSRHEFAAFLEAAKRGEYDHLTQEQP